MATPASPANERLKESYQGWLWSSLIAAALVHFAVFALWPELTARSLGDDRSVLEVISMPDVEIPEPPQELVRPAEPVVVSTEIDETLTIEPTTFEANPVETLPPLRRMKGPARARRRDSYPTPWRPGSGIWRRSCGPWSGRIRPPSGTRASAAPSTSSSPSTRTAWCGTFASTRARATRPWIGRRSPWRKSTGSPPP